MFIQSTTLLSPLPNTDEIILKSISSLPLPKSIATRKFPFSVCNSVRTDRFPSRPILSNTAIGSATARGKFRNSSSEKPCFFIFLITLLPYNFIGLSSTPAANSTFEGLPSQSATLSALSSVRLLNSSLKRSFTALSSLVNLSAWLPTFRRYCVAMSSAMSSMLRLPPPCKFL